MSFLLPTLAVLAAFTPTLSLAVSPIGQTVELHGTYYFLPANPVATLQDAEPLVDKAASSGGLAPLTVVKATDGYNTSNLEATLAEYSEVDDVFTPAFLEAVYVQYPLGLRPRGSHGGITTNVTAYLYTSVVAEMLPAGPYFITSRGEVYEAWKLYSDRVQAFTETLVSSAEGSYSVLPANIPGQALAVAVPSRLYFTRTAQKPLAGVRLAIKDIYDVDGVRTSNGNRAWYRFYPAAGQNAVTVQRLVDAGAVIVGKQKTSQFANGESPTADWVDYFAPFNPRGDGYQLPSSSSSGAGTSVAAYEWLDLALGSDTGGSIRGPSQLQGLYGNRPSHDLVSLEGVMPLAPELDTPGFLARDPLLWIEASKVLYGDNITITSTYPDAIKAVGFPDATADEPGDSLLRDFLAQVSSFVQANVTEYNFIADWVETRPTGAPESFQEFLSLPYALLTSKEQARLVRDPFFADYAEAYDGRRPFVNPVSAARWTFGDQFSEEDLDEGRANITIFNEWFASNVLVPTEETCSDSLLLYVGSQAGDGYRDVYFEAPGPPIGFGLGRASPFWGGPDFILPIGEATYFSNVTQHEEVLPVTVGILAARGCDGLIYGLVQDLLEEGILKDSVAGYSLVDGGELLVKRELGLQ